MPIKQTNLMPLFQNRNKKEKERFNSQLSSIVIINANLTFPSTLPYYKWYQTSHSLACDIKLSSDHTNPQHCDLLQKNSWATSVHL